MSLPIIGAIVLAAGESSRLGFPKQEIRYKGETLLVRSVQSVMAGCNGPVMIVLGANAQRISPLLNGLRDENLNVVINNDWQTGMGSSIACGMSALLGLDKPLDGVLVSLCDQPFLTGEIISQIALRAKQLPGRIVVSRYSGAMGPPAIFPKAFFPMLEGCSGDTGARHILKQHASELESIELPELAFDVDTPEERSRLEDLS